MSSRALLNIGYGNFVMASRVIAVVNPSAAPMKRLRDEATRRGVLWTSLGLVSVTLAPVALGLLGEIYLAVALGMNAWFVASVLRLLRDRSDDAARRVFQVSLAYLFSLFLAMNVEVLLRA